MTTRDQKHLKLRELEYLINLTKTTMSQVMKDMTRTRGQPEDNGETISQDHVSEEAPDETSPQDEVLTIDTEHVIETESPASPTEPEQTPPENQEVTAQATEGKDSTAASVPLDIAPLSEKPDQATERPDWSPLTDPDSYDSGYDSDMIVSVTPHQMEAMEPVRVLSLSPGKGKITMEEFKALMAQMEAPDEISPQDEVSTKDTMPPETSTSPPLNLDKEETQVETVQQLDINSWRHSIQLSSPEVKPLLQIDQEVPQLIPPPRSVVQLPSKDNRKKAAGVSGRKEPTDLSGSQIQFVPMHDGWYERPPTKQESEEALIKLVLENYQEMYNLQKTWELFRRGLKPVENQEDFMLWYHLTNVNDLERVLTKARAEGRRQRAQAVADKLADHLRQDLEKLRTQRTFWRQQDIPGDWKKTQDRMLENLNARIRMTLDEINDLDRIVEEAAQEDPDWSAMRPADSPLDPLQDNLRQVIRQRRNQIGTLRDIAKRNLLMRTPEAKNFHLQTSMGELINATDRLINDRTDLALKFLQPVNYTVHKAQKINAIQHELLDNTRCQTRAEMRDRRLRGLRSESGGASTTLRNPLDLQETKAWKQFVSMRQQCMIPDPIQVETELRLRRQRQQVKRAGRNINHAPLQKKKKDKKVNTSANKTQRKHQKAKSYDKYDWQ